MAKLLISSLQPHTNYYLQFKAVSETAQSEWSRLFTLTTTSDTTPPDVPLWAVSNEFVSSSDTFIATWQPLDFTLTQNLDFDHYEISLSDGTITVTVLTNNISYTLTYAQNRAFFGTPKYSVSAAVRSVDKVGNESAWASLRIASNPPPSNIASVSTTTLFDSIKLDWPIATDSDLFGYRVDVSTTVGGLSGYSTVYSGTDNSFTYSTTSYLTDHYFKVYAVDKFSSVSPTPVQVGPIRPKSAVLVDTLAPKAPTSLAATITNNANGIGSFAIVTWTAPTQNSDNSTLTDLAGYFVRYRRVGDTNYTVVPFQSADTAGRIELQLAYTNYEFQIKAYDWQNNESAWTSTVTSTSPGNAAPANVTGLTSVAGRDSIIYSWTAVADTDIKNYEVTFSTSATFASGNITYLTGTATSLTVGGLIPSTTYYARVRAVDNGGNTSASFSGTDTKATGSFPVTPLTDTYAPGSSPTPNVQSGLSYLYATWAPVTLNSNGGAQVDPVTYEVHLSTTTGFTTSGATKVTEVTGTFAIIDILPGTTTPLTYGTTYFIKLVAKDRDGSAASGTQGSGSPAQVASSDVTSINANLIVSGTGIINNLIINTGGSIASGNYVAGTTGYKLDAATGLEVNTGAIKANLLTAGTLGSSTGIIQIASGASIVMNGGYLKSNTYTGTAQAANPSGAGFYLGNDGIRIDQGIISAGALVTSNLSAATITLTGTGSIVASGWTLNSSGISIPNGAIAASKLLLQDSDNLIAPQWADFEWSWDSLVSSTSYYNNALLNAGGQNTAATPTIDITNFRSGTQSLKIVTTNATNTLYLGNSVTDFSGYINPLEPSTAYIISFYAMVLTGGVAQSITPYMRTQKSGGSDDTANGVASNVAGGGSPTVVAADSVWKRYSVVITTPAAATGSGSLRLSASAVGTYYIDQIQIEKQNSNQTLPSQWTPPSQSTIVGGQIRTGTIQSLTNLTIGTITQPMWSINTTGAAQFGSITIRGNAVVGLDTSEGSASNIGSYLYDPDGTLTGTPTGWRINSDGTANFVDMTLGGFLRASSVSLSGNIDVNGTIASNGLMGEQIGIDNTGFHVFSPYTVNVTNVVSTSNTVTATTSQNHGFTSGKKLVTSGIGLSSDGTWTVASTPSATTFTYLTTASGTYGSTAVTGSAQSYSTDPGVQRSKLIDFPTDGSSPNIFSGNITANTLTVNTGSTMGGVTTLPISSSMVIAAQIVAPSSAPVVVTNYNDVPLTGGGSGITPARICKGSTANYFTIGQTSTTNYIQEYNSTTGAFVANRATYLINQGTVSGFVQYYYFQGIVYDSVNSLYHVMASTNSGQNAFYGGRKQILTFNTSWVLINQYVALFEGNNIFHNTGTIGWDYVNSVPNLCYHDGTNLKVLPITMSSSVPNQTGGSPVILPTGVGTALTVSGAAAITAPGFVMRRGSLDGVTADRYYICSTNYVVGTAITQSYQVYNSTLTTLQTNESWPTSYPNTSDYGAYYDTGTSKIYAVKGGSVVEYQTNDSYWSSDALLTHTRWVGYSWYQVANTHETDLSNRNRVTFYKRSQSVITVGTIPKGGTDTPDSARVYMAENTTEPTLVGTVSTLWHLRPTITYPSTTGTIVSQSSPAGAQPLATGTVTFTGGTVANIKSTATDSLGALVQLAGDGTWRMNGSSRQVGISQTTTVGSIIANTTAQNCGTVTCNLRTGRAYRAYFSGDFDGGTAGQYSDLEIKYGVGASVGGNAFAHAYTDYRMAGRIVGTTLVGQFTYAGTDNVSTNIVAVATGQGGTLQRQASTTWPTTLIVEEVW